MNAAYFDFAGLTAEQQKLLDCGGWTVDPKCEHSRPTLKAASALIDRGLLIAKEVTKTDRYGCYTLTEYRVPAAARAAWLAQRSKETA